MLTGAIAERLRNVGRRIAFVDNDIHEVRDLVAEAERRADATVRGVDRRLEQLEQSTRRFDKRTRS